MDQLHTEVTFLGVRFFNLFDTNRQGLQIVYSPDATFSLSVNSFIPHRSYHSKEVQSLPKQHTLHWQPYFNQSRNMLQTSKVPPETLESEPILTLRFDLKLKSFFSAPENIQSRLYSGPSSIVQALETLPKTQHPVNETDKFVIDAWAQPGLLANDAVGLFVSIHGQFYEGAMVQDLIDKRFLCLCSLHRHRARSWSSLL